MNNQNVFKEATTKRQVDPRERSSCNYCGHVSKEKLELNM